MDARSQVSAWLEGRAKTGPGLSVELSAAPALAPAEKLRRAYAFIAETALSCPYHDLSFGEPITVGPSEARVSLSRESYSSYVLLPLLGLMTSQRLLLVGAPGRGKTTMATLMALLAGVPLAETRRLVQHGHPQLTISDLLGSPLPSDLVRAEDPSAIRVAWRRWIGVRVKIIDEYNRIPTKTQSALLSLMAEGYAEAFEQVIHAGKSAWYLTANDDLGGGTFQVIEALKDRIDAVVRTTPYNSRFLDELASRVAEGRSPEGLIPSDVIFSNADLDAAEKAIRAVELPEDVRDLIGFFGGQLDFCRRASPTLELQNKDTLHLGGRRVAHVCTEDCPLDKQVHLCTQTENGISARAYQSLFLFAKALAWFRGKPKVGAEDVRQVLPFVLFEKLRANPQSAFFQRAENQALLVDRVTWIRGLFDAAVNQRAAYEPIHAPIATLRRKVASEGVPSSASERKKKLGEVERLLDSTLKKSELGGAVYDDLLVLKDLHARLARGLDG